MFYVFRKNQILLVVILIALIISAIVYSSSGCDKNIEICRAFLSDLGYSTEKEPYDEEEIKIPEGFGQIYENYNKLQVEAGFDLTPLRGCTVKRYSFHIKDNINLDANILFFEGKICGGDICNPSLSGYMLPLTKVESENQA